MSKKAQEKKDKIKRNIQISNKIWNDWNFQIHWNEIELINPRSRTEEIITSMFLLINFI